MGEKKRHSDRKLQCVCVCLKDCDSLLCSMNQTGLILRTVMVLGR